MTSAALLLLADSRLPAGGHGHSGGAEQAVRVGAITGPEDLARFLQGRLATTGLVTAALAAAARDLASTHRAGAPGAPEPALDGRGGWRELDAEADARTASPAQRGAARTQGRLLLRSARRIWPSAALDALAAAVPEGAHHPVVLGVVAEAAGCGSRDAALAAAYTTITGPATAAVRLLGLDPVVVHRVLAGLVPDLEGVADAACVPLAWEELPAHAAPVLDLLAEQHLRTEVRLFVS
ncbi:urease accessory UreF family protein [Sphaerisporangium sp. TRM90804]|uniref:urease accessory protein UreF n=1 Tax=Sphaerisporangium sp. TRM90804 TaxID=3031113 RepID=UPI00244898B9|nr:urease accessory UreF family protein [Sphaerisporangium sp. TRM90804]MDH2425056.1 urease accessory UreF family protein [Sphaerisporangium sp. TRM90804]